MNLKNTDLVTKTKTIAALSHLESGDEAIETQQEQDEGHEAPNCFLSPSVRERENRFHEKRTNKTKFLFIQ